jgi:RNA polymerase sigma factor (sigma-70 family)
MQKNITPLAAVNADSAQSVNNNEIFDDHAQRIIEVQASHLLRTKIFPEHMRDDLIQELSIILLDEIANFNPEKSSFHTFAENVIHKRGFNLIVAAKSEKSKMQMELLSLDEPITIDGEELPLGEAIDIDSVKISIGAISRAESEYKELRESIKFALSMLSPELRIICLEIMNGASITSLAGKYNTSRSRFRQRFIHPIRKVFKQLELDSF